ncbi:apolipoprotein N-acyltransferase [Pseudooceanicola aestuarii]|uniref:apolipoprotein N-acyltransferase n=1 Tax=Pseudooceanicola aestuarii TaxID=2697319 RepID=UPI0013D8D43A|nr:apolipoprotein N-acyltransferase [Pseudooceanicola aestuarii]
MAADRSAARALAAAARRFLPRPRPPWRAVTGAGLAGLVAASAQAPLSLWPLAVLGFAALVALVLAAPDGRRAGWTGWGFGTGYFLLSLNWIVEPFLVDVWRHVWLAPFALILLAGGLALFWAAAAWGATRLAPRPGHPARALALVAAMALAEALRGWIFTGFPWAAVGHGFIASPFLSLAAWLGTPGLTLLLLTAAAGLGLTLHRLGTRTGPLRAATTPAAGALLLLGGSALLAPLAAPALPDPGPGPGTKAPVIRLVQPNARQRDKWDPEMIPIHFNRLLDFSATPPRPDLVVWPETAVPWLLNEGRPLTARIAGAAQGAPVVLGVQRAQGSRVFNSLAVIAPDGAVTATYDKHHLVPFGEYMPAGDLLARIGIGAFAARQGNGYTAGPGPRLVDLPGIGAALPLICYEGVFPRNIHAAPDRPALLLMVTNDAWFGRLSGPYQHLAQARLRAVEFGLPMVRVANTGISAMIDAGGTITGQLALNTAGFLDLPLPPAAPPTLYSRIGDSPALALALLLLGGAALWRPRRIRPAAAQSR